MGALAWRPLDYSPAAIDLSRLPDDKRDLINLVDRIGEALNEGRSITVDLDQDQVNRWIAAREQIWADDRLQLPPEIREPQIRFVAPDRLVVLAQAQTQFFSPIVQIDLALQASSEAAAVRCAGMRIGGVWLPESLITAALDAAGAREKLTVEVAGLTIRTANDFVWRNGNRRFAVSNLQVEDGRLRAVLRPLSRTAGYRP